MLCTRKQQHNEVKLIRFRSRRFHGPSKVMDNMNISVNSNNVKEVETVIERKESDPIILANKKGLLNVRAIIFLLLWYIFSGCTLFLNKYILTYLNGNPTVLGNTRSKFYFQH